MSAIKITKYDKILRKIVLLERRNPDGSVSCQRCGTSYPINDCRGLHISHYWGRASWTSRLLRSNVWLHCHGCHQYLGSRPHDFKEWVLNKMGQEKYDALMILAKGTFDSVYGIKKKFWLEDWYEEAKKELKELENEQSI